MRRESTLAAILILLLLLPSSASCYTSVALYQYLNFVEPHFATDKTAAVLPPPYFQQSSSALIENEDHHWTIFWETKHFDPKDKQLWVEGPRRFEDLSGLKRPTEITTGQIA